MNTTPKNCTHYPYYNPSFASQPDGAEWKSRNRRAELFAHVTGLCAVKTQTEKHRKAIELIRGIMHLDHASTWLAPSGALFVLNEPYFYSETDIAALEHAGFQVRIVPVNLAPYGGRFDSAANAEPWTTSILTTRERNREELDAIYGRLKVAAETAPAWNT